MRLDLLILLFKMLAKIVQELAHYVESLPTEKRLESIRLDTHSETKYMLSGSVYSLNNGGEEGIVFDGELRACDPRQGKFPSRQGRSG